MINYKSSKNDDDEDDASIDIEKTDDERTYTDFDDQVKGVAEMNIAEEANEENTVRVEEQKDDEELKADEEHKEDDKAGDEQVVVLVSTTHKEKPNLLQSTSSHSVSLNFGDQFINSPNATLIVPNSKVVKFVVQRFTELERAVKELKQADHSTTILASIRSQVPSVVKEYLGFSLP
ncbi:hypothetical protein Tco_1383847, partial [Tanacetum coccineum]